MGVNDHNSLGTESRCAECRRSTTRMIESPLSPLSDLYLAALRTHLTHGESADPQGAQELGSQAVSLGLETLNLARMHDQAMAALVPPDCSSEVREDMTRRAAAFFTEVIVPVEKTHLLALEAEAEMKRLKETLGQRTLDLADSNRDLQQGILERQTAEAALESSERASSQLLMESRLMEKSLRDITHQILAANEVERKKMSLVLHDEISQTLLGIHVRLLALKREAAVRHVGFTQEIATTQRVVEESVKTINRFALEFGIPHET
ncbi:MAG: nreB [Prosthecobacter sp.]|nr:nreB [Prosthecobacter sp.]